MSEDIVEGATRDVIEEVKEKLDEHEKKIEQQEEAAKKIEDKQ